MIKQKNKAGRKQENDSYIYNFSQDGTCNEALNKQGSLTKGNEKEGRGLRPSTKREQTVPEEGDKEMDTLGKRSRTQTRSTWTDNISMSAGSAHSHDRVSTRSQCFAPLFPPFESDALRPPPLLALRSLFETGQHHIRISILKSCLRNARPAPNAKLMLPTQKVTKRAPAQRLAPKRRRRPRLTRKRQWKPAPIQV